MCSSAEHVHISLLRDTLASSNTLLTDMLPQLGLNLFDGFGYVYLIEEQVIFKIQTARLSFPLSWTVLNGWGYGWRAGRSIRWDNGDTLLRKLSHDKKVREIVKELSEGFAALLRRNIKVTRLRNPIRHSNSGLCSKLPSPGDTARVLNNTGSAFWTHSDHLTRAACRMILESSHWIFEMREINVYTILAARLYLIFKMNESKWLIAETIVSINILSTNLMLKSDRLTILGEALEQQQRKKGAKPGNNKPSSNFEETKVTRMH